MINPLLFESITVPPLMNKSLEQGSNELFLKNPNLPVHLTIVNLNRVAACE